MNESRVRELPFRKIPHQSELYLAYLERLPDVLGFYRWPATLDSLSQAARALAQTEFPRSALASILERQNRAYGNDSSTERNIEELRRPDCVAVLTGRWCW